MQLRRGAINIRRCISLELLAMIMGHVHCQRHQGRQQKYSLYSNVNLSCEARGCDGADFPADGGCISRPILRTDRQLRKGIKNPTERTA
eukprot:1758883-Amphidinium_carterae.1